MYVLYICSAIALQSTLPQSTVCSMQLEEEKLKIKRIKIAVTV